MVSLTRITAFTLAALLTGCSLVNATSSHMGGSSVDAGLDAPTDRADAAADAGPPPDAHAGPDAGRIGPPRARVVHLARDTASVNAFSIVAGTGDEATLAEDLTYATVSARVDAPEGMRTINVVDAGGLVVVSELLGPFLPNTDYTIAFYGDQVDPPFGDRGPGVLLLEDDASGLDTARDIRLSVVHLASSVSAGQLVTIDRSSGGFTVLARDVDFTGVATLRELPAMGYRVGFDAEADSDIDVEFELPAYFPGTYANVFIGSRGDGSVFLLSVVGAAAPQVVDVAPPR